MYNYSPLLLKIDQKFKDIHKFCAVAELDPVKFLENIGDGDLTADDVNKCVKVLDIPQDEIGFYFFRDDETWRRSKGRPKAEIRKTTTPPTNNRYYTISEASRLLNVHRHTLQARLRDGELKGKLIGRTWRIYRDELFDNSPYKYFFECNDAYFGDKYLTPSQINEIENHKKAPLTEGQIIAIARNLEATLYRCDDQNKHEVCIYDCMDI